MLLFLHGSGKPSISRLTPRTEDVRCRMAMLVRDRPEAEVRHTAHCAMPRGTHQRGGEGFYAYILRPMGPTSKSPGKSEDETMHCTLTATQAEYTMARAAKEQRSGIFSFEYSCERVYRRAVGFILIPNKKQIYYSDRDGKGTTTRKGAVYCSGEHRSWFVFCHSWKKKTETRLHTLHSPTNHSGTGAVSSGPLKKVRRATSIATVPSWCPWSVSRCRRSRFI